MRRLAVLAAAVAIGGCGQSAEPAEQFQGEEREVAEVVADLQSAAERREADRICKEILADALIEDLEEGGVDCADELEKALREADDNSLDVTDVTIADGTATATVEGREGDEERVATFELVQERGAWRISALR